ncbi:MAG: PfkB family carbohydrate kinase [Chlamydiales bacterium]|nr:PfkB family carbohydrate kinase [Chlamydiales bacterium]
MKQDPTIVLNVDQQPNTVPDFNSTLAKALIKASLELHKSSKKPSALVGFDGFTDDVVAAVATRESPSEYTRIEKISDFGQRIIGSAGVSCNIEFVPLMRKIGGNAPILANALLESGHTVSFIGAIGKEGAIEPLFHEMARRCKRVISLAASSHSDAVEFNDGKVILGKHESLIHVNYETLLEHVHKTELIQLLDKADLFVSANWTMLPLMNTIWEKLQEDILPFLSKRTEGNSRHLFIDLADPAKRLNSDLKKALSLLSHWPSSHSVILGLNTSESVHVASILNIHATCSTPKETLITADTLRKRLSLHGILIHTKQFAVISTEKESATLASPFCKKPLITTGAGDNFNAGFCSGLLYQLPLKECLGLAIATAGFYIRNGKSPTTEELITFLSHS